MKIFGWTLGRESRSVENPNLPLTGELLTGLFGAVSQTGLTVTSESAMKLSAFQAGVRVIAETIASLPFDVFVRLAGGGKSLAWRHPVFKLLHSQPNPETTAFSFRETMICQIILWGNAYIQTVWDNSGQLTAMWLVHPTLVRKFREADGSIWYQVTARGKSYQVPDGVIIHIPGLSMDGWLGRSVVDLGVNALGQAQAIDTFTSKYFGNGAFPSGFLSTDKTLSTEARGRVLAGWRAAYSGVANAHKVAVFEEGMKWNALSVDPEKAQLLLTKSFSWAEIMSLLRVPLVLVGMQDKASSWGTGIEQIMIGFAQFTIRPWLVRIEQAFNVALFLPSEQGVYFAEHNIDGLLRGDYKSRQEGLAIQRQWGIINADEWRAVENMNPQSGGQGKTYLVPLNLTSATLAGPAAPAAKRALLVATCDLLVRRESSETRKLLARSLSPADLALAQPESVAHVLTDDTLAAVVRSLCPAGNASACEGVLSQFRSQWAQTSACDLGALAQLPEAGPYVRSITELWNQTRAKREADALAQLIEEAHHEG